MHNYITYATLSICRSRSQSLLIESKFPSKKIFSIKPCSGDLSEWQSCKHKLDAIDSRLSAIICEHLPKLSYEEYVSPENATNVSHLYSTSELSIRNSLGRIRPHQLAWLVNQINNERFRGKFRSSRLQNNVISISILANNCTMGVYLDGLLYNLISNRHGLNLA